MSTSYRQRPRTTVPKPVPRALRRRMTRQEARLWVALRRLRATGPAFRRQCPIGPYVVDFACLKARLVVEVDGGQHGFDDNARRDRERDRYLSGLGFEVLRFWNYQVDMEFEYVMEAIHTRLGEHAADRRSHDRSPPAR